QMLCGYYAFSEYTAPRAALYLMSQDNRKDGLLSICTPDKNDLTIPSFSLHYFTAVYEYTVHSQDKSLAEQVYPKLRSILSAFLSHMEEGILPTFLGQNHWNFYEWTDGLAGNLGQAQEKGYDAALNCLFSIALEKMQNIATILGKDDDFSPLKEALNRKIKEHFYVPKTGLFKNSKEGEQYSELVCALAILCGATTPDMIQHIAHTLTTPHEMTKVSLSMCCFVYDALLVADKAQYTPYILADIDRKYKAMLDQGATSFWETEEGEQAFDNAGSLCHGWSAMPVYYYHLLGECHT
ncbi:MAG: hypothetical protein J6R42_04515, partial [Clostridia bacterium]|nr:hypothetical protein [Clostridia bacterium]